MPVRVLGGLLLQDDYFFADTSFISRHTTLLKSHRFVLAALSASSSQSNSEPGVQVMLPAKRLTIGQIVLKKKSGSCSGLVGNAIHAVRLVFVVYDESLILP